MNILGLNIYSPKASACLIQDGRLIAAIDEAKLNKRISYSGFPKRAIEYCVKEAGIALSSIDFIAVNYKPKSNRKGYAEFCKADNVSYWTYVKRLVSNNTWLSVEDQIKTHLGEKSLKAKVIYVNHQMAHLSSAYFLSPFDKASIVNFDDMGDYASTAWGIGVNDQIQLERQIQYPHSLGIFYRAFLQYFGFDAWNDEDKLIALAETGLPRHVQHIEKLIMLKEDGTFDLQREFFAFIRRHEKFEWSECEPYSDNLYSNSFEQLLGPARRMLQPLSSRHRDIAKSALVVLENTIVHVLTHLHKAHNTPNLALSGHIAQNYVLISKLPHLTPYEHIFVSPFADDAGSAIGAAQSVLMQKTRKRLEAAAQTNLIPDFSDEDIQLAILKYADRLSRAHCSIEVDNSPKMIAQVTAIEISLGNTVGWFQGKMQSSPQGVGSRSILYDPRRDDVYDVLSHKLSLIDRIQNFRIAILKQSVREWFVYNLDQSVHQQYVRLHESKSQSIPPVINADGKALVNIVDEADNELFHALLKQFVKKTALPFVLDIPFKYKNMTVISPSDALEAMLATNLDILVLGQTIIRRNRKSAVKLELPNGSDIDVLVR